MKEFLNLEIPTILLFIIIVLLVWDLYILKRIYNFGKKGQEISKDEKYYELKFNINLLKSISAILIFIFGFLGFSNYRELKDKLKKSYLETIEKQKSSIDSLSIEIHDLSISINNLKKKEKQTRDDIISNRETLQKTIAKSDKIKQSFINNPKIYIIKDQRFYYSYFNNQQDIKIYFKDLRTIFGEKLPNFSKPPMINVQGQNFELWVLEITSNYFKIFSRSALSDGILDESKKETYFKFDVFIASEE